MTNEMIYCAVNKDGEIQSVPGFGSPRRYFMTESNLRNAVDSHNKENPSDKWFVSVCVLKEVKRYIPMDNIDVTIFGGVI